jgi:hypothetical protein
MGCEQCCEQRAIQLKIALLVFLNFFALDRYLLNRWLTAPDADDQANENNKAGQRYDGRYCDTGISKATI